MGSRRQTTDPLADREKSREIWLAEKPYLSSGISTLAHLLPVAFERAENDVLWDVDGARYIDWSGGMLTTSTGHCNERVSRAIKHQLDRLWNIHDQPSATRARVLGRLARLLGSKDYTFQFYTTGSETVEAALRAALSAVSFRRRRVASFAEGYHGKTRGSLMAVHALFGRNVQPPHLSPLSLPFPNCYRCPYDKEPTSCELHCARTHVEALESDGTVGMLLFEPILGTGGVYGPPDGYWETVGEACKRLGILLVADEISTGVFRTGTFLAVEQLGVEPDLVAFGKGLGSGFPTMVLAGRSSLMRDPRVFDEADEASAKPLAGQDFRSAGSSSSTFGGNPLAMAAVDATLDELERLGIADHVRTIGEQLYRGLREIAETCPAIGDVRGYGMMLGVELVVDRETREPDSELAVELYRACAANGLLIKVDDKANVQVTPPLTHTAENAARALEIFGRTLRSCARG